MAGETYSYEGKKGYLTSFSIKKPDTEDHVPHRILTDAIRNKGISNKIELTDVHNYEFILEAGLGEGVLVYAWIHQVDELDFLETCEIFKVSHKDLKKHWQQHASEYVTTSVKILPLSATKAGANMSFFIRNSKHMEAAQEGIA